MGVTLYISSISSLYPLDANPSPNCEKQNYVQTLPSFPWEAKSLPVKNHLPLHITYIALSLEFHFDENLITHRSLTGLLQ